MPLSLVTTPRPSLVRAHRARRALLAAWIGLAGFGGIVVPAFAAEPDEQVLRIEGMTFVASRAAVNEITLRAQRARFLPRTEYAYLETVDVNVARGGGLSASDDGGFEMTCERGELDLRTSDFRAEGNVRGRTEDGRRFSADWVAYDDEEGVLYTDDPVLISEAGGTYRGGGFRYYVQDRRFRLLGGATVVQDGRIGAPADDAPESGDPGASAAAAAEGDEGPEAAPAAEGAGG